MCCLRRCRCRSRCSRGCFVVVVVVVGGGGGGGGNAIFSRHVKSCMPPGMATQHARAKFRS
jgi:hypothetical protein